MVAEIFCPQLVRNGASLCLLCGGKTMNGYNCTTASDAMWLYRASQGRVHTDACHVRDLTNDCTGGTNLRQVEAVNVTHYGITTGKVYQPIDFDQVAAWVRTGRYGAILDISYAPLAGGTYDRFHDTFFGNHAIFLSGPGSTSTTLRTGDPGAGGYANIPTSLLKTAAGKLDLGGSTVGYGKCYAYVTPIDPPISTHKWSLHIAAGTKAVSYVSSFGNNGCIAGWTNHPWTGNASSAPCRAPITRVGCSSGSAKIAYVTAGVFAGKYVRLSGGVTAS